METLDLGKFQFWFKNPTDPAAVRSQVMQERPTGSHVTSCSPCSLTSARTRVLSITPPLACWWRSFAWRRAQVRARQRRKRTRAADWRAAVGYLAEFGLSTAVLLDQVTQLVVDVLLSAANLLQGLSDVLLQFVQVALHRRDAVNSGTTPAGGATHPHKPSCLIPTFASRSEVLIPSLCWCIWSTWILQSCTTHTAVRQTDRQRARRVLWLNSQFTRGLTWVNQFILQIDHAVSPSTPK